MGQARSMSELRSGSVLAITLVRMRYTRPKL